MLYVVYIYMCVYHNKNANKQIRIMNRPIDDTYYKQIQPIVAFFRSFSFVRVDYNYICT